MQALSDSLQIPSLALAPVLEDLEAKGILTANENGDLMPARELARIQLRDILEVIRSEGDTGSYREPAWEQYIDSLGDKLDEAVLSAVGTMTLTEFVDAAGPPPASKSAAGDGHLVDEDGPAADSPA